jgi:recombination protein RecA
MEIADLGNMLKSASQLVPVDFIATSIPSVNDVVFACGGVPRGRVTEIFAEESQGKSTFAQWLVGQAQKQGFNAFWVDAEKTFDQEYAKGSGVDTDKLMMLDFSFMEDLHYKLKLMTASNLFDIGVVDSVNSILPQDLGDARIEGMNMNERLIPARKWSEFFHVLEGGYRIKDLKTGKFIQSNVTTKIINEKKLIEESTNEVHKISQKKLALILINHKQPKIGVSFGQKWYTPGGKRKDFAYSVRLDITRKKTDTGQVDGVKGVLKHRIVQIKAMKNKVGIPLGVATLKMTKEGDFQPVDEKDLKNLTLVDEVEKIPDKDAEGALDLLAFKLAKDNDD